MGGMVKALRSFPNDYIRLFSTFICMFVGWVVARIHFTSPPLMRWLMSLGPHAHIMWVAWSGGDWRLPPLPMMHTWPFALRTAGMVSVTLNAPAFWNRVGKILDAWAVSQAVVLSNSCIHHLRRIGTRSFRTPIGRTKSAWLGAPGRRRRAPCSLRGVSDRWWASEEEYCLPGTRLFPLRREACVLDIRWLHTDGFLVFCAVISHGSWEDMSFPTPLSSYRRMLLPWSHRPPKVCFLVTVVWRFVDKMWLFFTAQILQQLAVDGAILPIKVIARARAKESPNDAMPELLQKMSSSVCWSFSAKVYTHCTSETEKDRTIHKGEAHWQTCGRVGQATSRT